jgi:uncharacterized protein (DUF433 family)
MTAIRKRHTRELERFFDFLAADDVRIKGHRIGIEDVLLLYRDGFVLEQLVGRFPTLTREEIETTIRYYELNRERIDRYLDEAEEHSERAWRAQRENPPEWLRRLLERSPALHARWTNDRRESPRSARRS